MNRISAALAAVPLALTLLSAAPPAEASSAGGACADPAVLERITASFEYNAKNVLKQPVSIAEIAHMQRSRFEPRTQYASSVEREYCGAKAALTDGSVRQLWYLIEQPWGFAGTGRGVEYCLAGLDPWKIHGAHCRSVR
ncbi:hypothetical protein LXM94_16275 [Rhizobium sp. TRM95111]|uniref:hypothetical protein n=1 Tax=Rhizobium alarense TaxID=2846851 RepID=UPI001F462FCE|nr:hypothetical protein [Rhizobium alarense]MCF3641530.1 hypothetical protein [Rhizobium alarense]